MGPRLLPLRALAALPPLAAALGASGCWWVVAGGAGAEGGYVASQEERSAGETFSDQWIHSKVKTQLIAAPGVPSGSIKIKVRKGVVTLKGVIDSEEQRRKSVEAAGSVKGVKKVVDKLHISR